MAPELAQRRRKVAPAGRARRAIPARDRAPRRAGGQPPTPTPAAPHVAIALQYAHDVAAGAIVAGHWTRKACERHLRDLERQSTEAFPFVFSAAAAERICRFAEALRHFKGPKAGQHLVLEPWQCFFLCVLFGWLGANGFRRFRRFYLEVARGNGKSFLMSVIALYMLLADGESGAEVYSAATSRDQAKIVFKAAQEIARRSPELREFYGVDVQAHAIVQASSASAFSALASEDRTLDGLNVHFAGEDELHAHRTRGVHDVLETALGKRDQPMMGAITTSGSDRTGICYEVRTDLTKILDQVAADESFFGVIYTLDDDDPWNDETVWTKANPNLGVSVNLEVLRDLARKAERTPSARAAFETKHLDRWVTAMKGLFDMDALRKSADPELDRDRLAERPCIVSIDLAGKNDFSEVVEVYRVDDTFGKDRWAVLAHHYTNRNYVETVQHPSFWGWELEGHLQVHDGNTTDHRPIADDAIEAARSVNLLEIDIDINYNGLAMAKRLEETGLPVVDVPQSMKQLTEATRDLIDAVADGRVVHNGDPVLLWMFSNTVGFFDTKGNVYPRKDHDDNKIDAVVAIAMAISSFRARGGSSTSSDSPIEIL